MSANGAHPGSDRDATLSQRIDSMIGECRRRGAGARVDEVERLYTDGCAEVLALEAEQRRMKRRLRVAPDGAPSAAEAQALSERSERVAIELDCVRSQLRQLRAALEWVQSGGEPGDEPRLRLARP